MQLKHRAWGVLYMQALMDTLYELAGPIKGGLFLMRCVTISSSRRTLDLFRHVDGERVYLQSVLFLSQIAINTECKIIRLWAKFDESQL